MDTNKVEEQVKNIISKGVFEAKSAFEKAGDKIQNFTDKSVIKIEKSKLESKKNQKYAELGMKIEGLIAADKITFSDESEKESVIKLYDEILKLAEEIKIKEALL